VDVANVGSVPEETPLPAREDINEAVVADGTSKVVVVPADLLSWLHQEVNQLVQFDKQIGLFVARPQKAVYDRARLYATTIDDVPAVVTALSAKNFAVMSETGRITEIQQQDNSLQLLVWVVGVGVFFFGIITVFSVLMDATDRKRATVGILRVMGVSRSGVFMTILLRSAVIGVAAALASIAVGFGISQFLAWTPPSSVTWAQLKPIVSVSIAPLDLLFVAGGAVGCCCLGAIPPAWKASRLDPFDAIVEGRFH
jgi:putative ABC transport system permease protein